MPYVIPPLPFGKSYAFRGGVRRLRDVLRRVGFKKKKTWCLSCTKYTSVVRQIGDVDYDCCRKGHTTLSWLWDSTLTSRTWYRHCRSGNPTALRGGVRHIRDVLRREGFQKTWCLSCTKYTSVVPQIDDVDYGFCLKGYTPIIMTVGLDPLATQR